MLVFIMDTLFVLTRKKAHVYLNIHTFHMCLYLACVRVFSVLFRCLIL